MKTLGLIPENFSCYKLNFKGRSYPYDIKVSKEAECHVEDLNPIGRLASPIPSEIAWIGVCNDDLYIVHMDVDCGVCHSKLTPRWTGPKMDRVHFEFISMADDK